MTKEEAIKILRHWGSNTPATDRDCAVKMAIEALENPEPHWIPVTERLPEKEGFYLVTLEHKYGDETNIRFFKNYETNIRFFKCESGERYWSKWGNETITAWMPLPEPYKGVTE